MAEFFRMYFVLSYVSWPILLVLAIREGPAEEEIYPKRYYWLLGLAMATPLSAILFGWCLWAFPVYPLLAILFFQGWWKLRRPLTAWEGIVIVLLPIFAGLSLLPYRNSPLDVYDRGMERRLVTQALTIQKAIDRYASDSGGIFPAVIYGGDRPDDPLLKGGYLKTYPENPYYGLYRSPWFALHNFCVFDRGWTEAAKSGFAAFDRECRKSGLGSGQSMVNVGPILAENPGVPLPGQRPMPTPISGNFEYIPQDFNDQHFPRAYLLKVYGPYWKEGFVVYSSRAAIEEQRKRAENDEDIDADSTSEL